MQTTASKAPDDPEGEYRAIEATLLQTARGRWFLSEHGRRARRLDSAMLEEAMGRLQSSLREPPALLGQLKTEIEQVRGHLSETREDLAKRPEAQPGTVATADGPQHGILTAAEDIHELAWSLQAKAPDAESCEQIARHAARLYAMSLQQAIESARLAKLAGALDEACARLSAILDTIGFETTQASPPPRQTSISAILPPAVPPLPSEPAVKRP
jgi:hypothetical protein